MPDERIENALGGCVIPPKCDTSEIEHQISFHVRPPVVPKKSKISFPSGKEWMQMATNPYRWFIPLLDITKDMVRDYVYWWASLMDGNVVLATPDKEHFKVEFRKCEVNVIHDTKYWYIDISPKL